MLKLTSIRNTSTHTQTLKHKHHTQNKAGDEVVEINPYGVLNPNLEHARKPLHMDELPKIKVKQSGYAHFNGAFAKEHFGVLCEELNNDTVKKLNEQSLTAPQGAFHQIKHPKWFAFFIYFIPGLSSLYFVFFQVFFFPFVFVFFFAVFMFIFVYLRIFVIYLPKSSVHSIAMLLICVLFV